MAHQFVAARVAEMVTATTLALLIHILTVLPTLSGPKACNIELKTRHSMTAGWILVVTVTLDAAMGVAAAGLPIATRGDPRKGVYATMSRRD